MNTLHPVARVPLGWVQILHRAFSAWLWKLGDGFRDEPCSHPGFTAHSRKGGSVESRLRLATGRGRRIQFLTSFFIGMLFTGPALSERGDSDQPVHLEADRATVQDANKLATFTGNVVLTQGTLVIRADKMIVKEDASGFQHATAFGNLASFRQKRDGRDEYVEGWSERMEYDGKADKVQLFKKARLRRGQDEVHGDYISYDAINEFFQVNGSGEASAQTHSEGRVRAVIQPKKKEPAPNGENR